MADIGVTVLVSRGLHPRSNRPRRAPDDARAVELALRLTASEHVRLVHAGVPDEPLLRQYLGMGISKVTVLEVREGDDILPVLSTYLREDPTELILTGRVAEASEGSGFLPYALAHGLQRPIAANICDVSVDKAAQQARLVQALPRGERRVLSAPLPVLATICDKAPPCRQSAFAAARRGVLTLVRAGRVVLPDEISWRETPARGRPKRTRAALHGSATERLRMATQLQQRSGGRILQGLSPEDAAAALRGYLIDEGLLDG